MLWRVHRDQSTSPWCSLLEFYLTGFLDEVANVTAASENIAQTGDAAGFATRRVGRSTVGEMIEPGVDLGTHDAGTEGSGETKHPKRVRPSALVVRLDRQVFGVGVDGHELHSRSSFHQLSASLRCGEPNEQTPG